MIDGAKLTASGSNVVALTEANWCDIMISRHDLLKVFNLIRIRSLEI
jgi:hypothetical protein